MVTMINIVLTNTPAVQITGIIVFGVVIGVFILSAFTTFFDKKK